MAFFGVDETIRIEEINHQFKNIIRQKGAQSSGLHFLKSAFTKFDTNGNGKLELREFEEALGSYGLFPKQVDLKQLHKFYDVDGDGSVSYWEFVNGLTDKLLSTRKQKICNASWKRVSGKGPEGSVTGNEICAALRNPAQGELLLNCFTECQGGNKDGCVTYEEFNKLCREIAVQVPNDEYYEITISGMWSDVAAVEVD